MMKTKRTCPNATLIVAIAAALLAMGGPKDDVAAQETQKSDNAKTRDGDPRAKQGSVVKPRKASCRCGKLTVTYKGPERRNSVGYRTSRMNRNTRLFHQHD